MRPSRAERSVVERWALWLNREDVLILDTETTGLGTRSEVVEVAVLDSCGEIRFESLVLPFGKVPKRAVSIHGLSRTELERRGAPLWAEIHDDLIGVLRRATVILGWNARFDESALRRTSHRHSHTWPTLPWHDLLADDRKIHPHGSHSLEAAARRAGLPALRPRHRAAGDCQTVLEVMRAVARSGAAARGRRAE